MSTEKANEKANDKKEKLSRELHLSGPDNWFIWYEAFAVAMRSIGYTSDVVFTDVDNAKMANIIVANITEELLQLVSGLRRGTQMIEKFKTVYVPQGDSRNISFWDELTAMSYDGGCLVAHITTFNHLVLQNNEAGKASDWVARQRTLLRATNLTLQGLQEDFVSEFCGKVGKTTKKTDGQAHYGKNGKVKCWECGQEGYMRRNCPKRGQNTNEDENNGKPQDTNTNTNNANKVTCDGTGSISYSANVARGGLRVGFAQK
ncbi:hypothetical protein F5X96DRAFT_665605 [Biscogniauxia mediterranea]|nr:hypothetical protein F5X96DRAFT_665605 [Biscogniauxia mediterranea]